MRWYAWVVLNYPFYTSYHSYGWYKAPEKVVGAGTYSTFLTPSLDVCLLTSCHVIWENKSHMIQGAQHFSRIVIRLRPIGN
jgi:hypothetical protein